MEKEKKRSVFRSFVYSVYNDIKVERYYWKINLVVFLSLTLGLLVTFCCFAFVNSGSAVDDDPYVSSTGATVYYWSWKSQPLTASQFKELTGSLGAEGFVATYLEKDVLVPEWDQTETYSIVPISGKADSVFKMNIEQGRFLNQTEVDSENCYVCTISPDLASHAYARIGDHITINGISYEIVGIGALSKTKGGIYVSASTFYRGKNSFVRQHSGYLLLNGSVDSAKLGAFFKKQKIEYELLAIREARQLLMQDQQVMIQRTHLYILISIFSICFMFLNIYLIQLGRIKQRRYTYVIQHVLGCPNCFFVLRFFCQTTLMLIFANFLCYLSLPKVMQFLGVGSLRYSQQETALWMLGLSMGVSMVSSVLLSLDVARANMAAAMQKEVLG